MVVVRNTPASTRGEVNYNPLFSHVECHARDISIQKYQSLLAKTCFKGLNGSIYNAQNENGNAINIK